MGALTVLSSRNMDNTGKYTHIPLLRRRPSVDKHQAAVIAAKLFNLHIPDPSSIKELHSYDDRNFYMRGILVGGHGYQEYVLKIVNNIESSHDCLIEVQCDAMSFLQLRGYNCSTPVRSIFKTGFVKCKIPREDPPKVVSVDTDRLHVGENKDTNRIALETVNISEKTNNFSISSGNDTSSRKAKHPRNLVDGIEIYDGEEYCQEEFFVCSVLLLTFVPGEILNETPLNTQLLFNAGVAVGRMDRDLKDFACLKLERPGHCWDLLNADTVIERHLEAVSEPRYVEIVREVCESFRQNVKPKLHLLPKQIIHGDANYSNIVVTPDNNNITPYSLQDIGFIDFQDINYSCAVFELAISLMYILNSENLLSCGRTRMAGHFFAGYHSINPLSDEELELLHVLVASRFCQSLVFGAYTSKHVDSGNEHVLETAKNGWKNFEAFLKTPREEVLQIWLEMSKEQDKMKM